MVEQLAITERRACSYAGLSRTSYRTPTKMIEATTRLSAHVGLPLVAIAHAKGRALGVAHALAPST